MQRDLQVSEIDWVFCWRTSTGGVRPGVRDSTMNGRTVRYQPGKTRVESGLRTIVRGRADAGLGPPTGPRLDEQGAIARLGIFVSGYVTLASLVPARDEGELDLLREAARAAVLSGDARAWALAAIGARETVRWAIHLDALPAVVSSLAMRVGATWTLRVEENQLVSVGRSGRALRTLAADTVFDQAPLPDIVTRWAALDQEKEARLERQRAIDEILADIPAYKAKLRAEVHAQYPDMTDEQLEAAWGLVALTFGF